MAFNAGDNVSQIDLKIENLTVAYGKKPVLWDIDIDIPKGKMTAVMGPNGAGKSTLLKAVLGLVPKISGIAHFFPGTQDTTFKGNRNRIAYIPQSGSVDWDFPVTALDVVMMGCYKRVGLIKRPGKKERMQALEMLRCVGMEAYSDRQISKLSGGQQQRLFLARALMQNADIYFLDEPFKGVDANTERTIVKLLKSLKDEGKTIIVVHHDLQTAPYYFDHIVFLNIRVRAQGDTKNTFNDENLKITYGGIVEPEHYGSIKNG